MQISIHHRKSCWDLDLNSHDRRFKKFDYGSNFLIRNSNTSPFRYEFILGKMWKSIDTRYKFKLYRWNFEVCHLVFFRFRIRLKHQQNWIGGNRFNRWRCYHSIIGLIHFRIPSNHSHNQSWFHHASKKLLNSMCNCYPLRFRLRFQSRPLDFWRFRFLFKNV